MYKGFILSESLKNPIILNDFEIVKVIVEHHQEHKGEPKIWHDFKVKINEKEIINVCNKLAKEIKNEWYAHFWNKKSVYIVLSNKVFKIPREDNNWQSPLYQEFKKYAIKHGIEQRYIRNFLIED